MRSDRPFDTLVRLFPGFGWLRGYDRATLSADALASLVTAILLIPQSLAYALLAGLPPQAVVASAVPLGHVLRPSARGGVGGADGHAHGCRAMQEYSKPQTKLSERAATEVR